MLDPRKIKFVHDPNMSKKGWRQVWSYEDKSWWCWIAHYDDPPRCRPWEWEVMLFDKDDYMIESDFGHAGSRREARQKAIEAMSRLERAAKEKKNGTVR